MKKIPINVMKGGESQTILAGYYKFGGATITRDYNGATAILEIDETMKLKIPQATKEGFAEVKLYGAFDMDYPSSTTRRGRVQGEEGEVTPTLCANNNGISVFANISETEKRPNGKGWCFDSEKGKWFRVRKLTPRECFRLMDVKETDIDKLMSTHLNKKGNEEQVVSNSALYKCAGNSIVVNCMYHLFKQIYFPVDPKPGTGHQLTLF